jgi:metal-sulfur cluster biosynthetic enzyme
MSNLQIKFEIQILDLKLIKEIQIKQKEKREIVLGPTSP